MHQETFKALVVDLKDEKPVASLQALRKESLPPGDVVVSVVYSSLNYKDGLAVTGQGRIINRYPMVPGIDLAGIVEKSDSPSFKPGDQVLLTGWGIGERHWGGYAQWARVKADWLLPLPKGLTLKQAMGIGTAGLTSMLCVMALETHALRSGGRDVIVTGASGGVGSVAVAILAKLGYRVVASTGRTEAHDYLKTLGASQIIDRKVLANPSGKPLESERWGGGIDTVGGETLASLLRSMAYGASVASCGLAGGKALNTTVYPFILRGVNLLGIACAFCPNEQRHEAWKRLTCDLPFDLLDQMIQVVPLEEVPMLSRKIIRGEIRGRVVISLR